jgi:predicted permease
MLQDLRHAVRMLIKSPGFTVIAVLTLAVGIGANTAIFSVVHGVLLRPLPYPEPERIVRVWEQTSRGARVSVSFPNFLDWREQVTAFDSMAAYQGGREAVLGGTEPVFADVFRVTRGYFDVFGVAPAVGRTFTTEEERVGGVPAAVVSEAFWTQNLGGNPDLQTRRVEVRGLTCRVVGVMPAGFAYPEGADVWIPKELFADKSGRSGHNISVVARLRTGVSLAQADAQLDTVVARLRERYPDTSDALSATSVRLHEALAGGSRDPLLMLVGAVGLVLLIACANVAGTLLARGEERRKELAVRAALGAARWRIARQLLTENVVLSLGGALGGLLLAAWLVRALLAINPVGLPRHDAVGINLPVVLFALALAILTPLLFGLVPSLQVSRMELRETLSEGSRAGTPPLRGRVRSALVAAEVAVALLLLVGAALLIRSFSNVMSVDMGFDTRGIITAEMSLPGSRYPNETESAGFYRELLPKLRAIAGVRAAGAINAFPLSGSDSSGTFILEGDPDSRASGTQASYRVVTPGYFEAMGIPLLNGRLIGDEDVFGRDIVVAVNQDFVRRYIPSGDPIGRRFRYHGMDSLNEPWMTIVGVVGNVKHASLVRETVPEAYVSYLQRRLRTRTMTVAVRPAGLSMAPGLVPLLREPVRQADPDVPVEFSTLDERVGRSVAERRFTMLVLGLFAAIALLLAAVGIYGVLAYSVVQRTQEIGIRMALGADPRSVVQLMLRGAMGAVSIGVALGVAGALLATRTLQSFLFGVRPLDPLAFIGAVGLLTGVALLAGYVPARRATRIDPLLALRAG